MKIILFFSLFGTFFLFPSCNEPEFRHSAQNHAKASYSSTNLPMYSEQEILHLIQSTRDEAKHLQKLEIITYAVTKFIGEFIEPGNNSSLSAILPCDLGFIDDGIILSLANHSGMPKEDVINYLNENIYDCTKGCNFTQDQKNNLFKKVLNSLILYGDQYDLRTAYEASQSYTQQDKIFLSYGGSWNGTNYELFGFTYNLTSQQISKVVANPALAKELNCMMFRESLIEGDTHTYRFNDPCHYVINGGGISGNGGGATNDDGSQKHSYEGGIVNPPVNWDSSLCSFPSGVRITRFHLADRMEGGLFAGDSEVTVNIIAYMSNDPNNTTERNSNALLFETPVGHTALSCPKGKQIAYVDKNDISATTTTVITPATSGVLPTNDADWTLIESGFCQDPNSLGYDRLKITIFEEDDGAFGRWYLIGDLALDYPQLPDCDRDYIETRYNYEMYAKATLAPSAFWGNTFNPNKYYIGRDANDHFFIAQQEPVDASSSWFELELF